MTLRLAIGLQRSQKGHLVSSMQEPAAWNSTPWPWEHSTPVCRLQILPRKLATGRVTAGKNPVPDRFFESATMVLEKQFVARHHVVEAQLKLRQTMISSYLAQASNS